MSLLAVPGWCPVSAYDDARTALDGAAVALRAVGVPTMALDHLRRMVADMESRWPDPDELVRAMVEQRQRDAEWARRMTPSRAMSMRDGT